jgi:hypothetical protein
MRWTGVAVAWVLCAAGTGCVTTGAATGEYNFLANSFRNLGEWPLVGTAECRRAVRDCQRAKEAWREAQAACPDQAFSKDYAEGFIAGFRDYLDAGGNGLPPAVPPFRYRLARYDSPAGHQAVEDWYAGFRHGAAAARASGFRELNVIPLSAPPVDAVAEAQNGGGNGSGPAGLSFGPGAAPGGPPAGGLPPPLEVVPDQLPPPRPVTPPFPGPAPGGPGN